MSRSAISHPTTERAPSHAPPDGIYAPGISISRALGWFSVGLGLAELLIPEKVGTLIGVRDARLLRSYGVREFVCGIGILNSKRPAGWMWARVAGDLCDLRTLGDAAVSGNSEDASAARIAFVAVAGVTTLDAVNAFQLTAAAAMEG